MIGWDEPSLTDETVSCLNLETDELSARQSAADRLISLSVF